MPRLRKLYTNWRIILCLTVVLLMLVAIGPNPFNEGAVINTVVAHSAADLAGIQSPNGDLRPTQREVILAVNGQEIKSAEDFYHLTTDLDINETVAIRTDLQTYRIKVLPRIVSLENGTEEIVTPAPLGLRVSDAPRTNLRKGLDLQGGTRVVLEPIQPVNDETLNLVVDTLNERLNAFGLTDVTVAAVYDLPGILGESRKYVTVEMAGTTEEEVIELISQQGAFEAQIANKTVFRGPDVVYVCRTGECSGLVRNRQPCGQLPDNSYVCGFFFEVSISQEAAQAQAQATQNLTVITSADGNYLSEPIILYLDGNEASRLQIHADLKGRQASGFSISGSGVGRTYAEAEQETLLEMKRLQTILVTGSLPVELKVVHTDSISPALGTAFLRNALFVGFFALVAVIIVLIIVYRNAWLAIPIALTSVFELIITLGLASLVPSWSIDLAAVAGLIIAIGTGVNDQIVITDEALKRSVGSQLFGWKQRIKRAFFVIFTAYVTTFVAMIPLLFAGAGLLKGFAITTMFGITAGVLITRPAYAAFIDVLFNNEE